MISSESLPRAQRKQDRSIQGDKEQAMEPPKEAVYAAVQKVEAARDAFYSLRVSDPAYVDAAQVLIDAKKEASKVIAVDSEEYIAIYNDILSGVQA